METRQILGRFLESPIKNKIIIYGDLGNYNEQIRANRSNAYVGNAYKRNHQDIVALQLPKKPVETPIILVCSWYKPNKRIDPDNIAASKKYILDAMQEVGMIKNDGWKEIVGFVDLFEIDKDERVEIEILERR